MRILRGGSSIKAPGRGGRRRRAILWICVMLPGGEGGHGCVVIMGGVKLMEADWQEHWAVRYSAGAKMKLEFRRVEPQVLRT